MRTLNLQRPLTFFDLETTGTSVVHDRIVQLSILRVDPDGAQKTLTKLVHPGIPIPPEASAIHGIKDEDVAGKPRFSECAEEVYSWLHDCDLAGYNVLGFDLPLLIEEFKRCHVAFPPAETRIVDVMRIYFKKEPRTLKDAYLFYCDKDLEHAHDAEADVRATEEVLKGQLLKYPDIGITVEELHDYSRPTGMVDYAGKLKLNEEGEVVYNFGKKNKGKRVLADIDYARWMLEGDFPEDTKDWIRRILREAGLESK